MRGEIKFVFVVFLLVLLVSNVSAGVGIKWNKESVLVPENTRVCLTYSVYNPFNKDSNVKIDLSDSLQSIVVSSESETKFVPAGTSSYKAIPVEFCFKTPEIYKKDCLLFDSLICKQTCDEDMKIFSGEVDVLEEPVSELEKGGSGGSKTALSASAPLRVKVKCIPHGRNYSVVYIVLALIAGILLVISFLQEKKKTRKTRIKKKKKTKKKTRKTRTKKKKKTKKKSHSKKKRR